MGFDEQGHKADQRTAVWFFPGMAAKCSIFQGIKPDPLKYRAIYCDWIEPRPAEPLSEYARRLLEGRNPSQAILVAVSLGVLPAFEIARQYNIRGIVLISSVKQQEEVPRKFRLLRNRQILALLPLHWIRQRRLWHPLTKWGPFRRRFERYNRFMGLNSPNYLRWCLDRFTLEDWGRVETPVLHLHGDRDRVFPIGRIKGCTPVQGGTHAMVLEQSDKIGRLVEQALDKWNA